VVQLQKRLVSSRRAVLRLLHSKGKGREEVKQSAQLYEPATARQRLLITRLCMKLKIREPLEERVMSQAEAGRLIRELIQKGKR